MKFTEIKVRPFLRWAGGKSWLTKHIEEYVPENFNNYYEPFLGGGAIFLYLKSQGLIKNKAYLSDANLELINTYKVLKKNPKDLIVLLKKQVDNEAEYYRIRNKTFDNPIENAARFLFLNKTSFNGIYRVNSQGVYNVPYGYRKLQNLYDYDHLFQVSELLENTYFSCSDFKVKCRTAAKNDFVFIDPPYTVAHENNGFIQYNQSIFSWENQIQLSNIIEKLNDKRVHFILTNAYHKSVKELFSGAKQITISRASTIGGKGALRTNYKELLITNQ